MPDKPGVFTIAAKNYLASARTLMASVKRWHPEFLRFVVLADRIDGCFDPEKEDFPIIVSEDLEIPDSKWFHFKYSILELNTAVKPYACELLFQKYGLSSLVYLDSDIRLYNSLSPLLAGLLEGATMVLTPHLTAGIEDDFSPGERQILQSGTYNLGFIALRRGLTTFRFLRWWQSRLYDQCRVEPSRGLFVDQRWMDLAPGLFEGVVINRDPGYNVAYWNLSHRNIQKGPAGYTVNGRPLGFFHFSGFNPEKAELISRHQNRYRMSDLSNLHDLLEEYRDELFTCGYRVCKDWPYAYGRFHNGVPIVDSLRRLYYEDPTVVERLHDPFSGEGYRRYVHFWTQGARDAGGRRTGVPRFAYEYYQRRSDIHPQLPHVLGRDQGRFLEWMINRGQYEDDFDPALLSALRRAATAQRTAAQEALQERRVEALKEQLPTALPPICRAILSRDPSVLIALKRQGLSEQACTQWLNQVVQDNSGRSSITRLAHEIHKSRPDLQEAFPDPLGADALPYITWFLTYGAVEFDLPESVLAPLRRQWRALLQASGGAWRRLSHRASLHLLWSGARARKTLGGRPLRDASPEQKLRGKPWRTEFQEVQGINLIGYARAETGVGESVRAAAAAARQSGLLVRLKTVREGELSGQQDHRAGPDASDFPFPFQVAHVNAGMTPQVFEGLGREFFAGKYNIGYWAWELEDFPDRWQSSFQYVHEVWTPSTFCQSAISRKSPVPVVCVPHCIEAPFPTSLGRSHFGLPSGKFLFVTLFDVLSVFERKNPAAVIEAFRLAFGKESDCHLVIKVNNGDKQPEKIDLLQEKSQGYPITILDQVMSRQEVNALLGACDCLVSLHRSEGFGLALAEAMWLGKPVIATAYSGNMDFTHHDTAFLVGYQLRMVGRGVDPYPEDALWADPSLTSAIDQMQAVFGRPDLRCRIAGAGQSYVRQRLSPQAVGQQMRRRLEQLLRDERARAILMPEK